MSITLAPVLPYGDSTQDMGWDTHYTYNVYKEDIFIGSLKGNFGHQGRGGQIYSYKDCVNLGIAHELSRVKKALSDLLNIPYSYWIGG